MKIPFEIGSKKFLLEPYRTYQEKDILLASSFDIVDFERIFEILNFSTEYKLTEQEKSTILYKYREISLGDEIDIKFKCDKCGHINENVIEASNFIITPKYNDSHIKKLDIKVTDETLQQFVDINVEELDIEVYEKLFQRVQENQINFNFVKISKCLKCKTEKKFDMSNPKYIIEIMSEDTLMSLYKAYNFLIFFGKYSKQDVDSMYPFERSIFIGLLNKVKEDLK